MLDRLTAGPRDLRATLRAWIIADGNAERAARLLGVHAQTVREHVRRAEPVLERRLLAGGGDLYEVGPRPPGRRRLGPARPARRHPGLRPARPACRTPRHRGLHPARRRRVNTGHSDRPVHG
ncbi:hypothetical protein GCM10010389_64890 [Streptomyces echinoruber]|uniref:PucR C-terminal helix-turn-helix domain-containing protein n=1 Tax=Streptomyces echinoruber TaxID=68898 RepID=A0A918RYZ3_9ACTN|nr:hypothetical protein GCM10010389_64890 [Streptomyces echinoruber]